MSILGYFKFYWTDDIDKMKKNLITYILLFFLIAVNGFFLVTYMTDGNKKQPTASEQPSNFIAKELRFDKGQLQQFRKITRKHRRSIRELSMENRGLKKQLWNSLADSTKKENQIDAITSLMGQIQKQKEQKTFYYFKDVERICTKKQRLKLQEIIKEALNKSEATHERPKFFEHKDE